MKINRIKFLTYLLFIIFEINFFIPMSVAAQTTNNKVQSPKTLPIASSPDLSPSFSASATLLDFGQNSPTSAQLKYATMFVQKLLKKHYRSDEDVSFAIVNPEDDTFNLDVLDSEGNKADVAVEQLKKSNQIIFDLSPRMQFRPGKYKVVVTDASGKSAEQDFTWGVLAINTDRSIYLPQQIAHLSMAVLDDVGNMVCNAKLTLKITNAALKINDLLSTDNGKIVINPECQEHNFSLTPDYEAHYQVSSKGTYDMELSAQTKNGSYRISDKIIVQDTVPFDVERVSATRIYPSNNYPVQLNITANQDFEGKITETVPANFTITSSDEANSYDNMKTIYMNKKLDPVNNLNKQVLGASTSALLLPFTGSYQIKQGFGVEQTDPGLQKFYQSYGLAGHDGVDFGLPVGIPIRAVDDGNVLLAGKGDYGITIVIQHDWGRSYYGHLNQVMVGQNEHVSKGQQIGLSGNTGEATGPHLHFGMRPNNPDMNNGYLGKVDPLPYFNLPSAATIADGPAITGTTAILGASTSANLSNNPITSPQTITDAKQGTTFKAFDDQVKSQILDTPTTANANKVKIMTWNVSIKKGQKISLAYTFKAPLISPQFYLLGPLRFYENSVTTNGQTTQNDTNPPIFQETRQWQIAADAISTRWYNYQWQYRKQITIDHTKVGNTTEDETNFPVLVSLSSDSDLVANAQSTGNDILFTDSTGQTKLNHEIEKYNSSIGELEAWVNIPTLSHTTDTIIYIYFGNAAAAAQSNKTATWNSNFVLVYHMGETSGSTINDSTTDGYNGTQANVTPITSGNTDGAQSFNGTTSKIDIGNQTNLNFGSNPFTVFMWVNKTTDNNSSDIAYWKGGAGASETGYDFELGSGGWKSHITDGTNNVIANFTSTENGTWQQLVMAVDRSGAIVRPYQNGSALTTTTIPVGFGSITSTRLASIGYYQAGSSFFYAGKIDEVEISNTLLSAGWINTEYQNQHAPSTFITLGGVETKMFAPTMNELMRHGLWFCSSTSCTSVTPGVQPFTW